MSKIKLLRVFLNERLTAAAEEILGVVEKTIAEYEEEVFRLQSLLDIDIVLQPEINLHRAGRPTHYVCLTQPSFYRTLEQRWLFCRLSLGLVNQKGDFFGRTFFNLNETKLATCLSMAKW
ncbi:unnamed protein product [Oncorhynchus mykiss]|uniref:Uncharacterized protein n=1 Tax=Oncorhynchus mykiss TaxID=8022 RepID=A0A060Z904_ONCMY|nr:unnamed protein product [Oncorhynchus mykiss]